MNATDKAYHDGARDALRRAYALVERRHKQNAARSLRLRKSMMASPYEVQQAGARCAESLLLQSEMRRLLREATARRG